MKFFPSLLIILLFGAVSAFAQGSKDDAALSSLVKQMTNAQVAFDLTTLDRILTTDYIEISPLGEFDPRDKVMGFYKPEAKPVPYTAPTLEISETSIRSYGKYAVVIAKLTYTLMSPTAKMAPLSIRATYVCRREGKDWKIASAQYTNIRTKT